jgi:pimeloyl-ACP methyl ester carboxylesterase
MEPGTLYARSRDVRIAYQVTGAGPDLVVVPGLTSHLEIQWKDLSYRRFMRSLSSFCRVVRFDKRGTGLSDPVLEPPSRDGRISDLRAVISASKCHRPILFGFSDGGHIAIVMAASHARSVRGLILYGTSPRHPPEWAQRQLRADSAQILTERVPPHPRKKRSIWFKFDCVLRLGPIGDETLIARPLGKLRIVNAASPAYLARYGVPRSRHRRVKSSITCWYRTGSSS